MRWFVVALAVFGLFFWACSGEDTLSPGLSAEKEILSFRIVAPEAYGVINPDNRTISVTLPDGTDLSSLVPVIDVSSNATILPQSGVANDFTSPNVVYRVTAQDGSMADYLVTATTVPVSSACDLLSFSLERVAGTIDQNSRTIAVTLPQGTDLSALKPVMSVSTWATISPDADTARNFSSPVVYTVTAQDGTSSKAYTVTVTLAAVTWFAEPFTGFSNGGSASSYLNGSWSGLVTWNFTKTRSDQALNGSAPCLKNETGATLSATFPNGVGRISFKMIQKFTGSGGAVHVFANGMQVSGSPFAYSTTENSTGEINVGISGPVIIMISNNGLARPAIDDFSWTEGGASETDKPTVSISAPAAGANLTSSSTTVGGTAADPGAGASGVKDVWVELDTQGAVKATGTTSWSRDLSGLTDGAHTLKVYAVDNAGNISTTATVNFSVTLPPDSTIPTVAISTPISGQNVVGTAVTATGTATDPGVNPSGVKEVWVKLDTTGWFKASGTTVWTYTFSSPTAGDRTLSIYAVDNQNNCSTTNTRIFTFTYQESGYPYIVAGKFQPQAGDPYYSYYSSAAGLSGAALVTALQGIIDGHTDRGYDGLYTTYQASDNTSDGKVWDIYSDRDGTGLNRPYTFTHITDKCGNYSSEGDCYNREHMIPQSTFNSRSPMQGDAHHVIPTDGKVNGMRSSYPHGNVSSATWTSLNGSKRGTGSNSGYSGTVFDPNINYRGDAARIYFYFSVRYRGNGNCGSWEAMNNGAILKPWAWNVYRTWHEADPVSQKERDRNTGVQSRQGNRNPFIDYPGLTTIIDLTQ